MCQVTSLNFGHLDLDWRVLDNNNNNEYIYIAQKKIVLRCANGMMGACLSSREESSRPIVPDQDRTERFKRMCYESRGF